ncbi:MAG: NTP transferase domain-containing protein [Chloroflexi bacterium]|nr:NTP transferase domain-containing protein [Chloroflexota bacterium]
MKAVVLAAGEGSRMRPLTYTRPKVMLPIGNRPILEHLLVEVAGAGIKDFIFVVGYCDEQVRDYFGRGERWGVNIAYCQQRKQLGTADAIKMAENLVDDRFLVMNGDIVINREEINTIAEKPGNTVCLIPVKNTAGLGVVELQGGKVVRIHEKTQNPPSNLANSGLYLFTRDIFIAIALTPKSKRGEYEITDALQLMIDKGHDVSYMELKHWLDLSYPWDLLTANQDVLSHLEAQSTGEVEANAVIRGPVYIGRSTVVRSGSYIVGPVIIGEGCDIGPNCFIRPSTAIGDGCHIGSAVEVKNSIIMRGSKLPHHNYIGDSIIGEGCNFGAGTKVANLRLDKKSIYVADIDTGMRKLGAIVGDRVETGINASINVGTTIGNNCFIGPGAVVSRVILPGTKLF